MVSEEKTEAASTAEGANSKDCVYSCQVPTYMRGGYALFAKSHIVDGRTQGLSAEQGGAVDTLRRCFCTYDSLSLSFEWSLLQ